MPASTSSSIRTSSRRRVLARSAPSSTAFIKVSPIAPLVHLFGQPFPVAIGLLIAVAEIAIGLGALSGLLFRLSAAGGFALSILFWLTASWATKPYYYGPDLPYALGWLTLALAGTGGRFTIDAWLDREFDGAADEEPVSPERRLVLKAGLLGITAIAVAGLAGTVGASVLGRPKSGVGARRRHADPNGVAEDPSPSSRTPGGGLKGVPPRPTQLARLRRQAHPRVPWSLGSAN